MASCCATLYADILIRLMSRCPSQTVDQVSMQNTRTLTLPSSSIVQISTRFSCLMNLLPNVLIWLLAVLSYYTIFIFQVSQPDGRLGVNVEHSYADAPIMAHVIEFNFTHEYVPFHDLYSLLSCFMYVCINCQAL